VRWRYRFAWLVNVVQKECSTPQRLTRLIFRINKDNIFEWHFTIRGPVGTPFEGGIYHGRILLPAEYPFKPPNIVWLTVCAPRSHLNPPSGLPQAHPLPLPKPNGRFEVGTKICLTISAHHPEYWQPSWSSASLRLFFFALFHSTLVVSLDRFNHTHSSNSAVGFDQLPSYAW